MTIQNSYFQTNYSILSLKGDECKKMLQNILTSDVNQLSPKQWQFSALCNHQGRVLSLFRLIQKNENQFLIQLPQSLKEEIKAEIGKYAQFSRVTITDETDDYFQIILFNCNHQPLGEFLNLNNKLKDLSLDIVLIDKNLNFDEIKYNQLQDIKMLNKDEYCDILMSYSIAEIEKSTSTLFIAQMINLEQIGGLSYNKGCYIGQEVIARLHYRGRLTKEIKRVPITQIAKSDDCTTGCDAFDSNGNKMGVLLQKSNSYAQIVVRI